MSEVKLRGEGETKTVVRTRVRIECENCGEPADQRHSYLLADARNNPASSGYGKDDLTWCSDVERHTCKSCRDSLWNGRAPQIDGYGWCTTFGVSDRFAHMFLRWDEKEAAQ